MRTYRKYSGEFKRRVVETMLKENWSYLETARHFDIGGHDRVARWERLYLEEGPQSLDMERRGRGKKARPDAGTQALLLEIQRLRDENARLRGGVSPRA